MNKEGYKDPTAEAAIAHVMQEQMAYFVPRKEKKKNGNKRRSKIEKGQEVRHHKT